MPPRPTPPPPSTTLILLARAQICTDILYQPLTLLDCLHTFCGSCLREWFAWQAKAAATEAAARRPSSTPYTCPACRQSVRGTKNGWMLSTMLEGFVRAHPDRAKSAEERQLIARAYTPGDEVLLPVHDGSESEEEDSSGHERGEVTRRRRGEERDASQRRRRTSEGHSNQTSRPLHQTGSWTALTEQQLQDHDRRAPHVEHQPSLRSLLSVSDADPQDVQTEILQSIHQEGLLDGIDLDHLTPQQEEDLTERIADAYRRRRRRRGARSRSRSRPRSPRHRARPRSSRPGADNDASPATTRVDSPSSHRSRPPVSRPHVFEAPASHGRSASASQPVTSRPTTSRPAASRAGTALAAPASRSATDLPLRPRSPEGRWAAARPASHAGRRVTDPVVEGGREAVDGAGGHGMDGERRGVGVDLQDGDRARTSSNETKAGVQEPRVSSNESRAELQTTEPRRRHDLPPTNASTTSLPTTQTSTSTLSPETARRLSPRDHPTRSIRDSAPRTTSTTATPRVHCDRCSRPDIQHDLHYNCATCSAGAFNLCVRCYRAGAGCRHWFGFGYRAYERFHRATPPHGWPAGRQRPHVLSARRYRHPPAPSLLQDGAFCDRCHAFADAHYFHCATCQDGAWGFCPACVAHGHHCTHPLQPIARLAAAPRTLPLPHLPPNSYVALPPDPPRPCALCARPFPPAPHLYCPPCASAFCPACLPPPATTTTPCPLSSHPLARITHPLSRDGHATRLLQPAPGAKPAGRAVRALHDRLPPPAARDELGFPRNAEIRHVEMRSAEWWVGSYGGAEPARGWFPAGYVVPV